MMQTWGLTDGFVRTGIIALTYGQVSVSATRCNPSRESVGVVSADLLGLRVTGQSDLLPEVPVQSLTR